MNKIKVFKGVVICLTAIAVLLVILSPKPSNRAQPDEPEHSESQIFVSTTPIVENSVESVDNFTEDEVVVQKPVYTEEQLEILAIIIYQEAGGDACSNDTRLKVGNVFLNRVASPYFPDTFEEVATAKRQYGNLHWTGIKWPDRAKNAGERHAVQRAYDLAKRLLEGERVLPENVIWQAEFEQGDGTYCYQDGIYFCYSEVNE